MRRPAGALQGAVAAFERAARMGDGRLRENAEKGKALRRLAAEGLGQKLAGLVSLEGSGERPERIAESMSRPALSVPRMWT